MNRLFAAAMAVVALVGAGAYWYATQPQGGPGLAAALAQDASTVDTSMVEEMSMGNPDAKVTVIEYASFTCPHCKHFHDGPFKNLKAEYIDTGKINFIYREVYFDRFGLWAGMVARCGGPVRYFAISDMIFNQQRDWIGDGTPTTIAGNLRRIGKAAGLTDDQLDKCLSDADMARALVATYQNNAKADDINATPTFVINGQKYSNMAWDKFKAVLEEKLAE